MTTWTAANLEAKARHGFKNSIAGLPSLCGRARFPAHGAFKSTRLPYCRWCTDKAKPDDEPNAEGISKGSPWVLEERWIKPSREDAGAYYEPQSTRRGRKWGEDQYRKRHAPGSGA